MGADSDPLEILKAVQELVGSNSSVHPVLFGHVSLESSIPQNSVQFDWVPCESVIEMDDDPLTAIRHKKGASMIQGIKALRAKEIDAFISSGNTGALVAASSIHLSKLSPLVERSPLLTLMPTTTGSMAVVDVGGRVVCEASHLKQYAVLGAAFQRAFGGIEKPRVGLLNIGEESMKGREEHREAYQQIQQFARENPQMTFCGNVEGHDVFYGVVDVLVTDGFTGNVFLKTAEGISGFILKTLQHAFDPLESIESDMGAIEIPLNSVRARLDYSEYPGALLCGLDGLVLKCHGGSSVNAIKSAVKGTIKMIRSDLLNHLRSQIESLAASHLPNQ